MADKMKMLIADDARELHGFYREIFEEDFDILDAYDGVDALMMAVTHRPAVMILDVMMPLLDGRSLCSKLKKFDVTKPIKVVMVTGKTDHNDRLVGFEAGADEYIEKPVTAHYLARSVRKLVGIS